MKNMRITQSYNGTTSHKLHWYNSKDYKDYPIDDGGKDGGREGVYCPCDEMIVTAIKGVNNNEVTNTIWLVSTSKVITPTFEDIAFMTLTHSNDSDFKNIKVGTKFTRGQLIVYEGENIGVATHIHMVFGQGSSDNWRLNSNNKWVITGNAKKPEEVCYVDSDFTTIKNAGDIKWVSLPKYFGTPVARDEAKDQIEVFVSDLRARTSADTTSNNILGYINKGIYNIQASITNEGYTWYKVDSNIWIAYDSSWAVLYSHKVDSSIEDNVDEGEVDEEKEEELVDDVYIPEGLFKKILDIIKKFLQIFLKKK